MSTSHKISELISIVTPTFNSEQYILKTIKSVQSQTYPFWEMIIIDDGSIDNTPKIVDHIALNEPRIKWKRLFKNNGIAFARNEAVKMANGRFLAFLDHDDVWLPQKLETQVTFMIENNYHFTFTNYQRITETGNLLNEIGAPSIITYQQFLKNTIIGCLTVMIDRNSYPKIHFENILSNDLLVWLNLLKAEDGHGLQTCLAKYRIVDGSASRNKIKTAKSLWIIYRDYEKLSILYSIFCFFNWAINAILRRLK